MKIKFDQFKFTSFKVSGVPVHINKLPWANDWVEIRVLVHAGALNDVEGKEGTAHFFEHLPFDGTKQYPSFEIMEQIDRQVFMSSLNAYTNMDKTVFEGKVVKEKLIKGMEILADMVAHPLLLPSEIERERGVITQEIWGRYNNPKRENLLKQIQKNIYGENEYSKQYLAFGWSDTVAKITEKDILEFHKAHYHRDNIEIILCGDISKSEAVSAVKKIVNEMPKLKTVTAQSLSKRENVSIASPLKKEIKISAKEYFGLNDESAPKQTQIRVSTIVKDGHHQEWAILNSLLRQMIHEDLRGKLGATYSPQVSMYKKLGHCLWSVYVGVEPKKVNDAVKIIKENIQKIISNEKELESRFLDTKNMSIENTISAEYKACDIADYVVDDLSKFDEIYTLTKALKEKTAVKLTNLCDLAKKELTEEKMFWYVEEP